MAQPTVMDGIKVVNQNNKYVATDTWYPEITQDGMQFDTVLQAIMYAQIKRRIEKAEAQLRKALNEAADLIQKVGA